MNDVSSPALHRSNTPSLPSGASLLLRYRLVLGCFIVALVISGLTAFPLVKELDLLTAWFGWAPLGPASAPNGLAFWLLTVRDGLHATYAKFPWLAYGTDWLAFAHLVIAIAFLGPLKDPVKNIWVVEFGMIACVLVIPSALVCGPIRGIPWFWRLIDCSFGVFGLIPLALARRMILRLKPKGP